MVERRTHTCGALRASDAGRPVVVVSSDREVADGVRRHGAYPISSDTLLRRIARS